MLNDRFETFNPLISNQRKIKVQVFSHLHSFNILKSKKVFIRDLGCHLKYNNQILQKGFVIDLKDELGNHLIIKNLD